MHQIEASPNHDRCGRCRRYHIRLIDRTGRHQLAVRGGNDHLCPVHGTVSPGCCEPRCDRSQWRWELGIGPIPLPRIDSATTVTPLDGVMTWTRLEKPTPHTTHVGRIDGEDAPDSYILHHERTTLTYYCGQCRRAWSGGRDEAEDHIRQPHQRPVSQRNLVGAPQ